MEFLADRLQGLESVSLLQGVLDHVQHGVTIARRAEDGSFPLVYVNPAFLRLTGYAKADVLGRDCRFLQRGEAHRDQAGLETLRQALRRGRAATVTLLNYRRGGEPFWNELTVSPIHDAQGEVTHFLGLQQDVTARLRSEEAMRQLHEQVAQRSEGLRLANASLRTLAAAMAHDLRAPLTVMRGFAGLARGELEAGRGEQALAHLERMGQAAERMDGMIDGTLQLARDGSRPLKVGRVDLGEIAREILAALRASDPQRAVEFEVAENLLTAGDPVLLYAMMENLLTNAWKYTATRALARIEVGRMRWPGQGADPVFFVRDNGVGFDASRAGADGFQPFRRYHPEGEFQGHGVGLASVRQVLARHGGSLRVRSAPGEGACFGFTVGEASDVPEAEACAREPGAAPGRSSRQQPGPTTAVRPLAGR